MRHFQSHCDLHVVLNHIKSASIECLKVYVSILLKMSRYILPIIFKPPWLYSKNVKYIYKLYIQLLSHKHFKDDKVNLNLDGGNNH